MKKKNMKKILKKIIACIMSLTLTCQLIGGVFGVKTVYAQESINILGETVQVYIEETP